MKIFLDDIRDPCKTNHVNLPLGPWVIVRDYRQFVRTIKEIWAKESSLPSFVAFDHDLGLAAYGGDYESEKTGYDCAKWLVEFCLDKELDFPEYLCHSMNPVGKDRIVGIIESYKNRK